MAPTAHPAGLTARRQRVARAAAQANQQRGVITREDLVLIGWGERTVDRRIEDGLLRVLWPTVYAFGHAALCRDGWLMAAARACGPGAHLCARASAAARGYLTSWSTTDVATPKRRGIELPGIRACRIALRPEERDTHRGLPVTSVARTALDVAAAEGEDRAAEVLDRALLAGHYDHAEMLELLAARAGCRGMAPLRRAVAGLEEHGVAFRSRPERLARDLLRGTQLPQPKVNAWFPTRGGHGHELDLWFPGLLLDMEVDGPQHLLPRQRRNDALRDADLRGFGIEVVRFRDTLVVDEPKTFLLQARTALERRITASGWR